MHPTIESTLADHGARITNLEIREKDTSEKLDHLRNWMMATLAGVALSLVGIVISLLKH